MSIENFSNSTEGEMTHNEARQHIEAVRAQIASIGANDSEFDVLDGIIEALEDQRITPQEAVDRANGVRDSKQSYH